MVILAGLRWRESERSRSRTRTFTEPNMKITLRTNEHISEILKVESQLLVKEKDFTQVVKKATRGSGVSIWDRGAVSDPTTWVDVPGNSCFLFMNDFICFLRL